MTVFDFNLTIGIATTIGLLAIGHWLPLPRKTSRALPATLPDLIARYVYGVLALWLGAGLWLTLAGRPKLALGLMLINVAGGATVVGSYGWDNLVLWVKRGYMARVSNDDKLA